MELVGIPGISDATRGFIQMVRGYTRDFPELNRLVAGQESTDRQIAWAILDAVADFNGTPHFTSYQLGDLLTYSQHNLMLRMTCISLIESVGLLQTRNHLNYNNGGFNVGTNDKTPLLMQWLQYFKQTTDQMKQRVKVALNIQGILSTSQYGVFSEYWAVNASWLSW